MKSVSFRWTPYAMVLAVALTTSACGEGGPLVPEIDPLDMEPLATYDSLGGVFHNQAVVTCDVTMASLTVACGSPQAPAGLTPSIGGKGVHIRLIPSNVSYNGGTNLLRMDVAIQNYLVNQIGTPDGSITGLTPFFTTLPNATAGSGAISVLNADGTASFIGPARPYFHYPQKLKLQETSSAREWQFNVPGSVSAFRFRIYVSAHILPVLVFDGVSAGNRDIWRVAADGSDLVRLTSASTEEMEPTAAQNLVVFTRYIGEKASLWSVPLSGGPLQQVYAMPENLGKPALDRSGHRLAFTRAANGVTRVWTVVRASGANLRELTGPNPPHPGAIETSPVWHPLSPPNRVMFVSTAGSSAGIYFRNNIGQATFPLVVTDSSNVDPTYSHDGTKIAFASNRRGGRLELYMQNAVSGVTPSRITTGTAATIDAQPSFLSDGSLTYVRYINGVPRLLRFDPATATNTPIVPSSMAPNNPYGVPLYP